MKFDVTTHGARKLYNGQNRMIQPWVNGDIDAKTLAIAPNGYWDGIVSSVDTMCIPNHPANTSNFHMSVIGCQNNEKKFVPILGKKEPIFSSLFINIRNTI